jgi:surface antigen
MNDTRTRTPGWRILAPVAAAVIALPAMTGCETTTHAQQGEVIGGVLGGVLGSQVGEGSGQTAAIIIGTMAGAMIGRQVGQTMDDVDRMKTAQALNNNRTGQPTTWTNPDTGYEYTVTPTRTFEEPPGAPCREFQLDATVGGEPGQEVYGTACLQPDGSWKIVQ